ncbi:hypothetical protein GO755_39940 [Spirosoma sp. HMF4905]|uniref:Uncharacterized protein n=1 Tax=Spirosoma arboris TaxID=2682092 RepID=A0A7K1SR74_9BACT|nr:hypothetical protein [Spirosoma arboris]MVM36250.1 hypothetical protein [Spirosoma arboris]
MKINLLLAIVLCAALATSAGAQDDQAATRAARKEKTREDVKRVGDKVETGVADGAHAVGTAGRATGKAVGKAGKATGKAVANGAKATGRAVTKATKATGRAVSGEAKKIDN